MNVKFDPTRAAELRAELAALEAARIAEIDERKAFLVAEIATADKNLQSLRAELATLVPSPVKGTTKPRKPIDPNAPLTDRRQAVLDAVIAGASTPKEIMTITGDDNSATWYHLVKLVESGKLVKDSRGFYSLPSPVEGTASPISGE